MNSYELKKNIDQNSFIKKIEIKKIFPNKLVIKVFEKEPIAIFIDKYQKKYYLGKKTDLIDKIYMRAIEMKLPLVCSNPDILGVSGENIHPSTGDLAVKYKKWEGRHL